VRGGSIDRPGFAPDAWARRILLPYGLARPGGLRANAPSSPLLCRLSGQYTGGLELAVPRRICSPRKRPPVGVVFGDWSISEL